MSDQIAKKLLIQTVKVVSGDIPIARATYDKLAKKIYELAGISLPYDEKNEVLIKNRMSRLLRKYNWNDFEVINKELQKNSPQFVSEFISCITTNKTEFFREDAHFTFLAKYLKEYFSTTRFEFRIWCAASSTGQEPYTMAILIRETLPEDQAKRCRIIATDIDQNCLNSGEKGIYTEAEMFGLNPNLKSKYFDLKNGSYYAKPEIKEMVKFSQFNLAQKVFSIPTSYNFIFCRNVLIYFDVETVTRVINNLTDSLQPGGYLIVGHSESGAIKNEKLKPLGRATYQKIDGPAGGSKLSISSSSTKAGQVNGLKVTK